MQPLRRASNQRSLPEPQVSARRLHTFSGVILFLLGVLLLRLWYLQVVRGDRLLEEAIANGSRPIRAAAPRGAIEDSAGRVLVTNRAQFTVFVVPADLPKEEHEQKAVFNFLARLLEMTPDDLRSVMKRNQSRASDPIAVKEDVSLHELSRIAENRLRLPGITAQVEPVRFYPGHRLAAHLLGSIGQINPHELAKKRNEELGYQRGDFIGKSGVEYQYDALLNGEEGRTWYEVDAHGRRLRELRIEPAVAGATLRLGLNKDVQLAAEKAMAGYLGAAVALDPRNGLVLAMVSKPNYDPNLFAKRPLSQTTYDALKNPKNHYPLINRAIYSPQPPGSTFKIVTAAAGVAGGAITGSTGAYCSGGIWLGGRVKRCHSRHGSVNLDSAIAASCDVFFYQAGFRIQPTPLAQWAGHFGLGKKTGVDLPTERGGTVPSPAWKRVMAPKFGNPDSGWYPGDTANMAIGQGDLQTTPLQMALVAGGVGNNGVIYKPRVVERAFGADKRVAYQMKPEVSHKLPISSQQLRMVAQGMRSAVDGPRGTSRRASLPGIAVAGKSGSAETRGGGPTHAWFICYAPFEKPTIAVCVFLETRGKGLHGGADAAPIAREMMAAHFKLPGVAGMELKGR